MKCDHCDKRIIEPFEYGGMELCCECMSVLCSWLLDGGQQADPELFASLWQQRQVTT